MNLTPIINAVADEADEILAFCNGETQARAELADHVSNEHPELKPAEQKAVVAGVMQILADEGFFEAGAGEDAAGGVGDEAGESEE